MNKQTLAFKTESDLQLMSKGNMKLLFTTHGMRLLGIVTVDKMRPDESLGARRRWIKGLVYEDGGSPLPLDDRIFETSLHRKNPKTGQLQDIVAHEDDLTIVMERKTFDLSDDESNFQFMPNFHVLNQVEEMQSEIAEGRRRLSRLQDEREQALLDTNYYKREADTAVEREKTLKDKVNRLSRENSQMNDQLGNYEAELMKLRSRNVQYESEADEKLANAEEIGTVRGMTHTDQIIHSIQKQKEIESNMVDILPAGDSGGGAGNEEIDALKEEIQVMKDELMKLTGGKPPQQKAASGTPNQPQTAG